MNTGNMTNDEVNSLDNFIEQFNKLKDKNMNHPLFEKHEKILSEIGETYVKITNMADRHFQITRETALDFAAWKEQNNKPLPLDVLWQLYLNEFEPTK